MSCDYDITSMDFNIVERKKFQHYWPIDQMPLWFTGMHHAPYNRTATSLFAFSGQPIVLSRIIINLSKNVPTLFYLSLPMIDKLWNQGKVGVISALIQFRHPCAAEKIQCGNNHLHVLCDALSVYSAILIKLKSSKTFYESQFQCICEVIFVLR